MPSSVTSSSRPNGWAKFLSRTFWIGLYIVSLSAALDWFKDKSTFVVVAPAFFTGWFGMKITERIRNGK